MLRTDSLQTYACLAAIQGSNEAPAFVLYIERLALSLEIGIELRKFLPEVVERTLEVFVWHEEVLLYIFLFYAVTCLAGENHQLANHVHTAQVDTWIRLAVALLLSQSHGLREWNDAGDGVEDKVERTRENCLNLKDFISGVAEIVDGSDDRETGTYVGLETEYYTTLDGSLLQFLVVLIFA